MFLAAIASSPMILRTECVQDIGLLSTMTSSPGDPGILFDVEYSLRAWSKGWKVGLYETDLRHGVGGHSSLASDEKIRMRNEANGRARAYIGKRYPAMMCKYTNNTIFK